MALYWWVRWVFLYNDSQLRRVRMSGAIVRKREGKGERIALLVSPDTKNRWETIQKALLEKGFEIDTDQAMRRIIRSLESVLKEGAK
jgi:hypothetical protein